MNHNQGTIKCWKYNYDDIGSGGEVQSKRQVKTDFFFWTEDKCMLYVLCSHTKKTYMIINVSNVAHINVYCGVDFMWHGGVELKTWRDYD